MTHTGRLPATSNNEIGKIGTGPKGCGENPAILHSRPRRGPRTAFGLGFTSTTRAKTYPGGAGLAGISIATPSTSVV